MSAKKAGIVIAGTVIIGGLACLATKIFAKEVTVTDFVLVLKATGGGTVQPKADTYIYQAPKQVTVKAVANTGYVFTGWFISGQKVSSNTTYTLIVDRQILLIAQFSEEGGLPIIPSFLAPVKNTIAEHWWKVYTIRKEWIGDVLQLTPDYFVVNSIKFKLQDNVGNGVPNQQIAMYSDTLPDATDTGYMLFADSVSPLVSNHHYREFPFIAITDKNGIAEAFVVYWHFINGCPAEGKQCYKNTVGTAGRVHYQVFLPPLEGWFGPPVWHDLYVEWALGANFDQWERLRHPVLYARNPVHAYWVDNPSLPVTGDAFVDCYVKVMDSARI